LAEVASYSKSEVALAKTVIERLDDGMLCLAERRAASSCRWKQRFPMALISASSTPGDGGI
jgi:hypothetical protein